MAKALIIFGLLAIAYLPAAEAGLIGGAVGYWVCMGCCTAGHGAFAGLMSAGVATGAGIVYGAAACATTCSAAATACAACSGPV